jgi:choline dehydrogenase-like flavoprotein
MKEYMRKHQTLEPIDERITERSTMPFVGENHGTSGPVRTSFNDSRLPIENDVIKAADDATGLTKKPIDPWSGDHIGFYNTLGAVARTGPNKGKRSYAARGYFEPNQYRPNLRVTTESLVAKVVLEGKKAVGAEYIHNGQRHQVKARREVIVCGGVINSPQILELSGIGNPEILRKAGVEPLVDLPSVGENYQDHVVTGPIYQLAEGQMSGDSIYKEEVMAMAQKALMEEQGGPLTGVQSVQGFFPCKWFLEDGEMEEIINSIEKTKSSSTPFQQRQIDQIIKHIKSDTSANLQLVFVAATGNFEDGAEDQSKLFPPPAPGSPDGVTFAICLQYPVARGSIHIKSANPTDPPVVDPNYLGHEADVAVLAAGMKFAEKMVKSPHLKDKIAKRITPPSKYNMNTIQGRRDAVREYCIGEYHSAGSCAMGDTVDSRLRVKGVEGLRVADASIFSNHVSGNIVSTVYAVAEKAADLIKEDWDYAALKKGGK